LRNPRLLFILLFAALVAARLCHIGILWEGDTYPLAAAQQMAHGKLLYRDIWFDKPPLLPAVYLLWGAYDGVPLRLAGALYALLLCWIAYGFARDYWSQREGVWAAGLTGFFLIFDFPSSVIPVASDLLMVAPHIAAVWMAWKRRPFWSGIAAGLAFWINPKGLLVAAVCALWDPLGIPWMAAGFAAMSGVALAWLGASGALSAWWEEVWIWGRLYAGSTFVESPLWNGAVRTLGWIGFHAAAVAAAAWFAAKNLLPPREASIRAATVTERLAPDRDPGVLRWLAWLLVAAVGVQAGLRFFPRYYFLLLPVVVLMAARGFALLDRKKALAVAALLLIPAVRFAPSYWTALRGAEWRDAAMDRDSRAAAALIRQLSKPGDTLFAWGYRPELYVYTKLPAATMYIDSQPLTGVPADRHLTDSHPVETVQAARRRAALAQSRPDFLADGLGPYNPQLAIGRYAELHDWFAGYQEVGRTGGTIVYRRVSGR
jgi:hypothetical protein